MTLSLRPVLPLPLLFGSLVLTGLLVAMAVAVGKTRQSDVIAYTASPDGQYRLYLTDVDRDLRAKLDNIPNVEGFAFSPDHRQIAFATSQAVRSGVSASEPFETQLYVMSMMGGTARPLNHFSGEMTANITWSPDNQHIAFSANRDGAHSLYQVDITSGDERKLTNYPGYHYGPVWSPDGTQIAFVTLQQDHWEVDVMEADGSHRRELLADKLSEDSPAWSPDGTQIAFVNTTFYSVEIYLADVAAGKTTQLTDNGDDNDYSPVWSPDGTQIAFLTRQNNHIHISIINADGTNLRQLPGDSQPILGFIVWSADSRRIAYLVNRDAGHSAKIVIAKADGSGQTALVSNALTFGPLAWWTPGG